MPRDYRHGTRVNGDSQGHGGATITCDQCGRPKWYNAAAMLSTTPPRQCSEHCRRKARAQTISPCPMCGQDGPGVTNRGRGLIACTPCNLVAVRPCLRKRRFDSEAEIFAYIATQHVLRHKPVTTYGCALCDGWHWTRGHGTGGGFLSDPDAATVARRTVVAQRWRDGLLPAAHPHNPPNE